MSELEGMLKRQGEEGYRTGMQEEVRRPWYWWSWSWSWWFCPDFLRVVRVLRVVRGLLFVLLGERGTGSACKKR